MPASRTRRCSSRPTAGRAGRSCPGCATTAPDRSGSRAPAALCLHTILIDPTNHAAHVHRDLGGRRLPDRRRRRRRGSRSIRDCGRQYIPDPTAEVGHCVHRLAMHRSRPHDAVHAEALGRDADRRRRRRRGPRSAAICRPTSASSSTCTRTSRRRSTWCRSRATPSTTRWTDKLRVYRSRTGGNEWEPLTKGLPQRDCYVNVLRDAMSVDALDSCGIYFGTTGGQVYASANGGDTLGTDRRASAAGAVGRGADAPVTWSGERRGSHESRRICRRSRASAAKCWSTCAATVTQRAVLDALEAALSRAARHDPRSRDAEAPRRSCASSPARKTCRTNRPTRRSRRRSRTAPNRSWSSARSPAADAYP